MTYFAIDIRPATINDAPGTQAIYAPYVADTVISFEEKPPTIDEMAGRIQVALDGEYAFLVAEDEGRIVGYAYASQHRARPAYRASVDVSAYVAPDAHHRGIGRKLYDRLLLQLAARKFHAAFAGIALPNPASVALHEATGFTHVGTYREVGFKLGAWHDVGWWQRLL